VEWIILCAWLQACNNLVVLARDGGGTGVIVEQGGMGRLIGFLKTEKDPDLLQATVRVCSCLTSKDKQRVRGFVEVIKQDDSSRAYS